MRDCVDRFDVGGHLRFGQAVDEARWDEDAQRWVVRRAGGEEYRAPVLVWATGSLSEPSIPDFPGSRATSAARSSTPPAGSTAST